MTEHDQAQQALEAQAWQPSPAQLQRLAGYLGIAHKAGKIAAGDSAAQLAIKSGTACLVIIAQDAAPSVWQEIGTAACERQLPLIAWPDKQSLGSIFGKSRRGAAVLCDQGFAQAILKLRPEQPPAEG